MKVQRDGTGADGLDPMDIDGRIELLLERGLTLYSKGDLEGAVSQWQHALALDPEQETARRFLVYIGEHFKNAQGDSGIAPFGLEDIEASGALRSAPAPEAEFDRDEVTRGGVYSSPVDEGWFLEDEPATMALSGDSAPPAMGTEPAAPSVEMSQLDSEALEELADGLLGFDDAQQPTRAAPPPPPPAKTASPPPPPTKAAPPPPPPAKKAAPPPPPPAKQAPPAAEPETDDFSDFADDQVTRASKNESWLDSLALEAEPPPKGAVAESALFGTGPALVDADEETASADGVPEMIPAPMRELALEEDEADAVPEPIGSTGDDLDEASFAGIMEEPPATPSARQAEDELSGDTEDLDPSERSLSQEDASVPQTVAPEQTSQNMDVASEASEAKELAHAMALDKPVREALDLGAELAAEVFGEESKSTPEPEPEPEPELALDNADAPADLDLGSADSPELALEAEPPDDDSEPVSTGEFLHDPGTLELSAAQREAVRDVQKELVARHDAPVAPQEEEGTLELSTMERQAVRDVQKELAAQHGTPLAAPSDEGTLEFGTAEHEAVEDAQRELVAKQVAAERIRELEQGVDPDLSRPIVDVGDGSAAALMQGGVAPDGSDALTEELPSQDELYRMAQQADGVMRATLGQESAPPPDEDMQTVELAEGEGKMPEFSLEPMPSELALAETLEPDGRVPKEAVGPSPLVAPAKPAPYTGSRSTMIGLSDEEFVEPPRDPDQPTDPSLNESADGRKGKPLPLAAAQYLADADALDVPSGTPEERTKVRINFFLEKADRQLQKGDLQLAAALVELALDEAPESAVAQKALQANRDLIIDVYRGYLGDPQAIAFISLPMHELSKYELDPRAAFLLSRVDGSMSLENIIDICGMPMLEAYQLLGRMVMQGILELRNQ